MMVAKIYLVIRGKTVSRGMLFEVLLSALLVCHSPFQIQLKYVKA